jgi:hypothetical protein
MQRLLGMLREWGWEAGLKELEAEIEATAGCPACRRANRMQEIAVLEITKDCFEATIKYFDAVLHVEYRRSSACITEHTEAAAQRRGRSQIAPRCVASWS